MNHYHIRWANSNLDWQAFQTVQEAEEEAERLKLPGERYGIEALDGDCPRCHEIRLKVRGERFVRPNGEGGIKGVG